MLPASFGGRIIFILQSYGVSFLKGAGLSLLIALAGTAIDVSSALPWESSRPSCG